MASDDHFRLFLLYLRSVVADGRLDWLNHLRQLVNVSDGQSQGVHLQHKRTFRSVNNPHGKQQIKKCTECKDSEKVNLFRKDAGFC